MGDETLDTAVGEPTVDESVPDRPELERRYQFETLLSQLTGSLVHVEPGGLGERIRAALKALCIGLRADRATFWVSADEAPQAPLRLAHYYQVDGGPEIPEEIASGSELFPWTAEQLWAGRTVAFSSRDELPAEAARDRESFRLFGSVSSAALPLRARGRTIGLLSFAMVSRPRRWSRHDLTRLRLCAQVFADALERQRAEDMLRALTQRLINAHEQESARLARDLHDDLTQRLALLSIEVSRMAHSSDPEAARVARAAGEQLGRLSEDVHALSYRLHPTVLEDLGLSLALRGECDRVAQLESLKIDLSIDCEEDGTCREAALCLFRVLQEALRNVVRHAAATTATVSLRELGEGLELTIRDDGAGFDVDEARSGRHLGLGSMRERLSLVGGSLRIESSVGTGTTVGAWVPRELAAR